MKIHRLAVVAAIALSAPVLADRISDSFTPRARDAALWTELESSHARGMKASQAGGKLRFTSRGKSGGAIYRFRKGIDWNDGFVVDWSQSARVRQPRQVSRSGSVGLGLGWGALDAASGFADGIRVQVVRTKTSRRLVMTLRRGGVDMDSVSVPVGEFEFDYRLVVSSGFGISIDVYRDAGLSPVLSMDGLDFVFASRHGSAMSAAFLASATDAVNVDGRIDGFRFWGDQFDDADDAEVGDEDGMTDDDDEDGYDDVPDGGGDNDDNDDGDGDDGDEDGGDDHHGSGDGAHAALSAASFNLAVGAIVAANGMPAFQAEVERVGASVLVEILQWDDSARRLVKSRVNPATGAIVSTVAWAPSAIQLARLQPKLDALAAVTVPMAAAVDAAAAAPAGSLVHEIEFELEGGVTMWEVETRTANGGEIEERIPAS